MKNIIHRAPVASCLIVALFACDDPRLRDLGFTLETSQPITAEEIPAEPDPCEPRSVSADEIQRAAASDLVQAAAGERPFLRYLTFGDSSRGECSQAFDQLAAAGKLLNATSLEPEVQLPASVDEELGLFRIDLRDYGWTREVSVAGRTFEDGWEAVTGLSPYAVPLDGPDAAFVRAETRTDVAVLSVPALVQAAADGQMYYALLGVPATLGELRELVGLPGELDPQQGGALRTALQFSRVLRSRGNLRLLDRYPTSWGTYWEAAQVDTAAYLGDPLAIQPEAQRLLMFSLPNGLFGFAVTDAAGQRQVAAELVLDTNRDDFTATVLTSCTNCHASGLIRALDSGRSIILEHSDRFPVEVVDAEAAEPSEQARFALMEADSEAYIAAVDRSGGVRNGPDPIAAAFFGREVELDLTAAASELLVAPAELGVRIDELPPALLPLALGAHVSRAQLDAVYAESYCVLHAGDENPPRCADLP